MSQIELNVLVFKRSEKSRDFFCPLDGAKSDRCLARQEELADEKDETIAICIAMQNTSEHHRGKYRD